MSFVDPSIRDCETIEHNHTYVSIYNSLLRGRCSLFQYLKFDNGHHENQCHQIDKMNFPLGGHLFLALILARINYTSANDLLIPQTIDINEPLSSSPNRNPNFFKDLRMLRISTTHFAPYMFQDGKGGSFHNGMEFELLQVIAKRLNMSLSFRTSSKRSHICDNLALK